jgi:hypothetical protein
VFAYPKVDVFEVGESNLQFAATVGPYEYSQRIEIGTLDFKVGMGEQ